MRLKNLRKAAVSACWRAGVFALVGVQPALAATDPFDGRWHFTLTPYIWIPGVSGEMKFNRPPGASGSPEVKAGPADVLALINFAFMGAADARRGRWSIFTDFIYLDLSGDKARVTNIVGPGGATETPVNLDTKTGLTGVVWTNAIGYTFYHGGSSWADVFVGVRDMSTNPSLDWHFAQPGRFLPQSGHISEHEDLWDGLIGVRGRFGIRGSHWFFPYYADIGTGESNFTGQAMIGAGYGFSWGDMRLAYRYLYYEPGQNKLIKNMSFQGLTIGATFQL